MSFYNVLCVVCIYFVQAMDERLSARNQQPQIPFVPLKIHLACLQICQNGQQHRCYGWPGNMLLMKILEQT
jgi:hypothetical protein